MTVYVFGTQSVVVVRFQKQKRKQQQQSKHTSLKEKKQHTNFKINGIPVNFGFGVV